MAYRGGGGRGGRGDQQYGGGRGGAPAGGGRGGGRGPTGFVWPPPGAPSAPRPAAPAQYAPAVAIYHNPNATGPHQGAYQHGVVVRNPAPAPYANVRASTPAVTIRAPSPTPVTVRAPAPTPSPAAAPFQPARASAPAPTTPAAVAKELEQKLFVTETALAPPAAAAAAAVAATQVGQAEAEKAPEVDLAPVSKKGLAHPARPGAGTVGKKVMIRANHFLVNVADNNLFHYDVSINPESKSRAVNREVLSELIKLHGKTSLGGKLPAYDGRKSLYTAGSLPFESEEFSVTLVDPEKKDKEKAEREYKITIRIAGRTDLYHLQQFLKGRQRDMPQETIQVLDVVLRESPSWNYVTVSRSFFSTTFGHRGDIGEGLECWRGYYQSLRPTQMGLSLNIDISATSFFKPVTVVQFMLEFLNLRDASRPLTDRDRVKIKKALRGVRVETNHQQDQIRRYKITGITPVPMSQLIFPVDERGTRMSVVQYFMQRYDYNLKHTSWPCLQSGSDARPVYLPMEACKIVEGQRYSKKLNDKQVTNILRATCQRPQQSEQSIHEMVLHNKYAEDKFAQEFGINVCSDLVSVPARVLPSPMLRYHDSGKEKTCAPSVGQWNMINKKFIVGGIIDNWACVSFSRVPPEEVHRLCCDLIQMCNNIGLSVNPRPLVDNRSASPNHIESALRDVSRRTKEMLSKQGSEKQLQLLIVILPEVSGCYGKIKKVCQTDLGIVPQYCCLAKDGSTLSRQYYENVARQIKLKVGGRSTVLERAFVRNGIPFVSEVPTIIFGADVTHPPPGEDSGSSIAAVVASMDWPEITKYRGLVSAQPHRQEIIEDLFSVNKDPQRGTVNGGMIRELLIAFRRKTGRRPERILFYRDGVSEGQFSHVLLHEMDAIRKACASLEEGYMPPVTFVVVQKRHHTRLFPEVSGRRDMTAKSGNILPGAVVDRMSWNPTDFDFYLYSHVGIQGPSGPTHYHVLYDENHFIADALQSFTKNLCNVCYARYTCAVSVVPPAYYAHLKAKLHARYHVEGDCRQAAITLVDRVELPKILLLGGSKRPLGRLEQDRQVRPRAIIEEPAPIRLTRPIPLTRPVPLTVETSLVLYVQNLRTLYKQKICLHYEKEHQLQRLDVLKDAANILGNSISEIFEKARETEQSWDGNITEDHFTVVNGRAVVQRKPTVFGGEDSYMKDSLAQIRILRYIYLRNGNKFQYMDAHLSLLADKNFALAPKLAPLRKYPLVYKSPYQKAQIVIGIYKKFEGLSSSHDKNAFKAIVNAVPCVAWPGAKDNYVFKPTVEYRRVALHKEYDDDPWGCFHCLRNYEVHSTIFACYDTHIPVHQILGDFVHDVICALLEDGQFDISEVLK